MKEELSRILTLLEEGKISAEEAERLIRAVNSAGDICPDPFRDAVAFWKTVQRSLRKSAMRRTRDGWKAYYQGCSWWEQSRADARSRPNLERLQGCLRVHGLADPNDVRPEASLQADLEIGADDLGLLRNAIHAEFDVEPDAVTAAAWSTVGDILDWLDTIVKAEQPSEAETVATTESA